MKKTILTCLLLFSFQPHPCPVMWKSIMTCVIEHQQTSWNKGDINGFMQGYWKSDSLLFVGSIAPTYGWQTTLDHYKNKYPDQATMGRLSFTILKVELLDKTNAFVLGAWRLKRDKDEPEGYFTLWFKKIKGEWKIVVDKTMTRRLDLR